MESPPSIAAGPARIAPLPFALGAIAVYILSFLSQVLISPPVTARSGVWIFALVQAALTAVWYVLHARRLRDAAYSTAPALAIAILYALAIVLLMLLLEPVLAPQTGGANVPRTSFADLWVFLLVFAAFVGHGSVDFFYFLALAMLVLTLAPAIIAVGFSIWTGTRAPAPPAAAI